MSTKENNGAKESKEPDYYEDENKEQLEERKQENKKRQTRFFNKEVLDKVIVFSLRSISQEQILLIMVTFYLISII